MESIDEAFRFVEKFTIIKNSCNKRLAQRQVPCIRIYRKRGSACAFQHMLRFKKRFIETLPAFWRWIPNITRKNDSPAIIKVMDSECETIDFKGICAIWVAIKIYAQLFTEVLYKLEIIHIALYAPRDYLSASAIRLSTVFSSRKRSGVIFTPYSSSSIMYSAKPIIDPQPGTVRNSSSGVTSGTSSMSATRPRKSSLSSIVESDHFLVTL